MDHCPIYLPDGCCPNRGTWQIARNVRWGQSNRHFLRSRDWRLHRSALRSECSFLCLCSDYGGQFPVLPSLYPRNKTPFSSRSPPIASKAVHRYIENTLSLVTHGWNGADLRSNPPSGATDYHYSLWTRCHRARPPNGGVDFQSLLIYRYGDVSGSGIYHGSVR